MKRCFVSFLVTIILLSLACCDSVDKTGLYLMTEKRDEDGQLLEVLEYDNAGNLSRLIYYSHGEPQGYYDFEYDQNNNLTRSFVYDQVPGSSPNMQPKWHLEQLYDQNGNRTEQRIHKYDSEVSHTVYMYDTKGNLIKEIHTTDSGSYFSTYEYNEKGILQQKKDYTLVSNDEILYGVYTYNTVGNIIQERRYMDGKEFSRTEYQYDEKGNLTQRISCTGTKITSHTEYEYDEKGHLIMTAAPPDTGSYIKYSYNEYGNVILEVHYQAGKEAKRITYSYAYDTKGCAVIAEDGCSKQYKRLQVNKEQADDILEKHSNLFIHPIEFFFIE